MKIQEYVAALKAEFTAEELPFIAAQCRTLAFEFESGVLSSHVDQATRKDAETIAALREKLAPFFHPKVVNLVSTLWEAEELPLLSDIAGGLTPQSARERHMESIRVVSAQALSSDEQSRIEKGIHEHLGIPAVIEFRVDSSIVGGIVIKGAGIVIDNSIFARLNQVTRALLSH